MDAVLNWLWQGGVVAVALSAMLVAVRRARANVRYVVCWLAAIVVIALPLLPSLQSAASVELATLPYNDAIVSLPNAWWTSTNLMLAAMVLWSSVYVFRFLSAIRATRRARRRGRPFPAHLESALPCWRRVRHEHRQARLVLSNSVPRAAVLGWGSPVIAVAPSLVRMLDANDLDRVLVHEWAHVQRRDDVIGLLQVALRAVAGWHPAVWWIDRRLRIEREIACDEMTVSITGSARSYAECLMKLSGMKDAPQRVQMAPAVFARSGLRARVMKIVSSDQPIAPAWSRTLAGAIVIALCVLSVALGSVTLVEATAFAAPVISVATRTLSAEFPPEALSPEGQLPPEGRLPPEGGSYRALPADERALSAKSPWLPPLGGSPAPDQSVPSPAPQPETQSTPSDKPREPETETKPQAASNAAIDGRSLPAQPPQSPPTVTAQTESAWTSAAASGSAVGRKSKEAGLATAGAFKRLAGRIAGSF